MGLSASTIPTLIVEGDNRAGLGYAIAQAINEAGINLAFVLAQVVGRRCSAVLGFVTESDASRAAVRNSAGVGGEEAPKVAAIEAPASASLTSVLTTAAARSLWKR